MEIKKPDKKSLLYLIVFIIIILVFVGVFYYFSKVRETKEELIKEERITEEILKQFRAPNVEGREIPEEILEQFGTFE